MNCQIAQSNLSAYLDRELPGDAMIAVRNHVEHCEACTADLDELRKVKASLGTLPVVGPREGFAEELMHKVCGTPQQPAPRISLGVVVATSVAAAVLALLMFNVFFGGQRAPGSVDQGRFDAASDTAVTAPDFGGHAPLIPVNR